MNRSLINDAAHFLALRRINSGFLGRLAPELRPATTEDAIAVQRALIATMDDVVGGWKCCLPTRDKINVGAIFANTIYDKSPCPVKLDNGVCRIEPEIAFLFKDDLIPRETCYSEADIFSALGGAHLALEFVQRRYNGNEEVSYLENLADCLFNQGVYIGQAIDLDLASTSSTIDFILTQGHSKTFSGHHPNNGPILPVFWLANFLSQQGIGIRSGQYVITGSFAGVHEVMPDVEFSLEYKGMGNITITLQPSA